MSQIVLPRAGYRTVYSHKTVSVTITMPLDMLMTIEDILEKTTGWSRSGVICYYIHMGFVKCRELAEQEYLEKEGEI